MMYTKHMARVRLQITTDETTERVWRMLAERIGLKRSSYLSVIMREEAERQGLTADPPSKPKAKARPKKAR